MHGTVLGETDYEAQHFWLHGNAVIKWRGQKNQSKLAMGFLSLSSFLLSSFFPLFPVLIVSSVASPKKKGLRVGLRSSISTMYQRFCVFLCLLCLLFYLPLLDFCSFIPFILLCSTFFLYYLPWCNMDIRRLSDGIDQSWCASFFSLLRGCICFFSSFELCSDSILPCEIVMLIDFLWARDTMI